MSDGNGDLERDIREEDELRRLLRTADRGEVPTFASLEARAERRVSAMPAILAAGAALALVAAVGLAMLRPSVAPAASPSASAVASGVAPSSPLPSGAACADDSGPAIEGHVVGKWLRSTLQAIEMSDPQTNQMRWVVRYFNPSDAPGPATIAVRAELFVGGQMGHVLGYEERLPGPAGGVATRSDGDLITVQPCGWATLVVRIAGPVAEGTFQHTLTTLKVGLPEGGTVGDSFTLRLACSARENRCSPLAAGATPFPTPTSNAALLKAAFGVIYSGVRTGCEPGSAQMIRREGDTDKAVGELACSFFNQFNGSVSADGRLAIYFAGPDLYLLDASKPNGRQKLLSVGDEIPGRPRWSSDGRGVVFTVQDRGSSQGVRPEYDSIRTLDLSTGVVREVARVTGGSHYDVVGWDRATNTIAAAVIPHASGTTTSYVVIAPSGTRTTPVEGPWSMHGSPDARTVVGVRCENAPNGCSVWTWPLPDFTARVERIAADGLARSVFGFRPGTDEVGMLVNPATPQATGLRVDLWSPASGARTIYRVAEGEGPGTAPFFRADGSAIFLELRLDNIVVVDVATGATTRLPQPTPKEPYAIGRIEASIRLD